MRNVRFIPALCGAIILAPVIGFAQSAMPDSVASIPGIDINTSVDPAEAYIGDLITYRVTIVYDSTVTLEPPPLGANLGAFDVKDYKPDVQTKRDDGKKESQSSFVLSTFTTGDYVIPAIPVVFTLPDGSRKLLVTEPVPIKIKSLLLSSDDSADIKANKAQFEYPRDLTPYYYGGGALVLLILAIVLWLVLRKKKGAAAIVDTRTPWEIARDDLALLQSRSLVESGKVRDYYFALTEIIKAYLGRMYQRDVLEMTTEQLFDQFASIGILSSRKEELRRFFAHADLVKFATYQPEHERISADATYTTTLIEQIRVDCMPVQVGASDEKSAVAPGTIAR